MMEYTEVYDQHLCNGKNRLDRLTFLKANKTLLSRISAHTNTIVFISINIVNIIKCSTVCDMNVLGVVHNCHHFHKRTQSTLGGGGMASMAAVRFF